MRRKWLLLAVLALIGSIAGAALWRLAPPADRESRARLAAANGLLDRGDFEGAVRAFRELVVREPGNAAAYAGLGQAYLALGDPERAVAPLETALALAPRRPHAFCALAEAYVQLRARSEALRAIDAALKRNPECGHAHLVAGEQWLRDDDLTRALAEFRLAIRHSRGSPIPYQKAGYVLLELGRTDEAERVLREGLRADPRHTGIHLLLGRLYASRPADPRALEQAEEHYRAALVSNPRAEAVLGALGSLARQRGDEQQARRWWQEALRLNPNQHQALYGMAQLELAAGRPEQAERFMKRFREVQRFQRRMTELRTQATMRGSRELRLRLARLALAAGIDDEAERQLAILLREHPADREVRQLQAELYLAQGRPERARLESRLAGRLPPEENR